MKRSVSHTITHAHNEVIIIVIRHYSSICSVGTSATHKTVLCTENDDIKDNL